MAVAQGTAGCSAMEQQYLYPLVCGLGAPLLEEVCSLPGRGGRGKKGHAASPACCAPVPWGWSQCSCGNSAFLHWSHSFANPLPFFFLWINRKALQCFTRSISHEQNRTLGLADLGALSSGPNGVHHTVAAHLLFHLQNDSPSATYGCFCIIMKLGLASTKQWSAIIPAVKSICLSTLSLSMAWNCLCFPFIFKFMPVENLPLPKQQSLQLWEMRK